jgi:DNA-binding winged helix-turn-helix (wHTH) protein/Tfp pilus assembly protein PilF
MAESSFRIGEWTADARANELQHDSGRRVRIEARAMKVLELLHSRAGQVVTTEEILDQVWEKASVSSHSVAIVVSALRKALGDDRRNPLYLETIPKRGYRLVVAPARRRTRIPAVAYAAPLLVLAALAFRGFTAAPEPTELDARYFQARQLWSRRDEESVQQALALLREILEAREDFAPAHLALADIYAHKSGEHLGMPALDTFREAQRHLDRARELDPTVVGIHVTQALLDFYRDLQPGKALAEIDSALALDAKDALAWQTRAMTLSALGRHPESLEAIARARELDPLSDSIGWDEVWFRYLAGDYDRAFEALERASRYSQWNYLYAALIEEGRGNRKSALESWISRFEQKGMPLPSPARVREEGYPELLRQYRSLEGYREYPGVVAIWELLAGEEESSLATLRAMSPDRENWMAIWLPQMPVFETLRSRLPEPHDVTIARR